jgi:hypothetical protein
MLPLFREGVGERDDSRRRDAKERAMIPTNKIAISRPLLAGAVLLFSLSAAVAGPCNTASKDAGSGKVPGYTGQTTGQANEHPPTANMNKAAGNAATSSQDTQRQMQGQPTTAQQGERDKQANAAADKGC